MNYVKRHYLKQLYRLLLDNLIDSPVSGSLNIIDNDIRLNIIGLVKTIKIEYTGIINIQNNLPGGYSIKLNKNIIKIRNINAKKLADDGLLFVADGDFNIISCNILCFNGDKFKTSINDIDRSQEIGRSDTKVEDETLIIQESAKIEKQEVNKKRSSIDDDVVTSLYTTIPFEDGYTGYYNYHPKEKVYLTGK